MATRLPGPLRPSTALTRRLRLRWNPARTGIGGLLLSIGTGLSRFVPDLPVLGPVVGPVLFFVGLVVVVTGFVTVGPRPVLVHPDWNTGRVRESLAKAPADATIRILQTWFPEEGFIEGLRDLLLHDGKLFDLRILLMEAEDLPAGQPDVLAARVQVRGDFDRKRAQQEIEATITQLKKLKQVVDEQWREPAGSGRRQRELDLEIRRYSFLPFGPIYQIGAEVMYVGFYVNYGSSLVAPMLEVRNTAGNIVWQKFDRQFTVAWGDLGSRPFYPQPPAAVRT